jgi:hypothetical protein
VVFQYFSRASPTNEFRSSICAMSRVPIYQIQIEMVKSLSRPEDSSCSLIPSLL